MTCDVQTPRLRLRIPEASDAQALLDIHEHPDVIRYVISGSARRGISGAWNSIATMIGHWHIRGYGQWTVIEKETCEVIGRVGLWHPEGWPGVELGWVIRHSRWGHGFATEAARASLDWTWRHSAVDHVISIISHDNHASIRVAQKIGESFERAEVVNAVEVAVYGVHRAEAIVKDLGPGARDREPGPGPVTRNQEPGTRNEVVKEPGSGTQALERVTSDQS